MKLLINLKDLELDKYLKHTNSFLIGIDNLSINSYEVKIEEIKNILNKYSSIELYINLNKNIFNEDIEYLKEILTELSNLKIAGIFFYDLSVLNLNKELNLNLNLIISQDHLITNYNICNYYLEKGVKYANLSSDITIDEILEIKENTSLNLIVFLVGHLFVTHSKRKLVSNFYEFINKEMKKDYHIIKEKGKDEEYYIIDNLKGTNILTKKVLNANREFLKLKDKISYGILDSNLIDDNCFIKLLELYSLNLNNQLTDVDFIKKTNEIIKIEDRHDGFFNRKTIYKVK